jgi:hypothetical protein
MRGPEAHLLSIGAPHPMRGILFRSHERRRGITDHKVVIPLLAVPVALPVLGCRTRCHVASVHAAARNFR